MPVKEKNILATIKELITKLEKLNQKIKNDPLLFYGDVGKDAILTSKELHIIGATILRSRFVDENSMRILKKIPLEI